MLIPYLVNGPHDACGSDRVVGQTMWPEPGIQACSGGSTEAARYRGVHVQRQRRAAQRWRANAMSSTKPQVRATPMAR